MKVEYTTTIDIDLDYIASVLSDTVYDVLTSEYDLDNNSAYQVYPQILDELWEKFKEQLQP